MTIAGEDARPLTCIATDSTCVTSPCGCVRFHWDLLVGDRLHIFDEHTREGGSHELRARVVALP